MTRCVYYRAYFHYAQVKLDVCAFSRREIVCASDSLLQLGLLRCHIDAMLYLASCTVLGLRVGLSVQFELAKLPQDPFGVLVASTLSMGKSFRLGGRQLSNRP